MEILLKFIAGEITVHNFENELYTNPELEELLRKSTDWNGTYVGQFVDNLYDYLIILNYSRTDDIIKAIDALEIFFTKQGVSCTKTNKYNDFYSLTFAAQPKYLMVDTQFVEKYILPSESNLTKAEQKKVVRSNFEKYFRFQNKPPRWIQNPNWIIKDDKPLLFVGQLDLKSELFHDNGAVYVFLNEESGEIETIKQFY